MMTGTHSLERSMAAVAWVAYLCGSVLLWSFSLLPEELQILFAYKSHWSIVVIEVGSNSHFFVACQSICDFVESNACARYVVENIPTYDSEDELAVIPAKSLAAGPALLPAFAVTPGTSLMAEVLPEAAWEVQQRLVAKGAAAVRSNAGEVVEASKALQPFCVEVEQAARGGLGKDIKAESGRGEAAGTEPPSREPATADFAKVKKAMSQPRAEDANVSLSPTKEKRNKERPWAGLGYAVRQGMLVNKRRRRVASDLMAPAVVQQLNVPEEVAAGLQALQVHFKHALGSFASPLPGITLWGMWWFLQSRGGVLGEVGREAIKVGPPSSTSYFEILIEGLFWIVWIVILIVCKQASWQLHGSQ